MNLFSKIIGGTAGIAIATYFLEGVTYDGQITTLLLLGVAIGFLNYLPKTILEKITFPIRLLTLNLFTIVIMMGLVWIVDFIFPSSMFEITDIKSLFQTSLIIWISDLVFCFKK